MFPKPDKQEYGKEHRTQFASGKQGIVLVVCCLTAFLFGSICSNIVQPVTTNKAEAWQPYTMRSSNISDKYLHLVEMAVTGSLHDEAGMCNGGAGGCELSKVVPYDAQKRREGKDWPPFGHTMIGHLRIHNIRQALVDVVNSGVPGHFAELGVWRGGACIYAKAVMEVMGVTDRNVYVFDAFDAIANYGGITEFLKTSEAAVRHNFDKYGVMDDRVFFQKGLFKDTLPKFKQQHPDLQLAVLRVDGNFYDSYQDALYYLFEMVPVGGYVIFDDIYTHPPVQQAWDDFKADQGVKAELVGIDKDAAYFKKTADVKLNMGKMKPPRDANLPQNK